MPSRDPYMRDRNIQSAASMQFLAGLFLGALLGWAVAGWFDLNETAGAAIGAGTGWLLASILLFQYGGRSTR